MANLGQALVWASSAGLVIALIAGPRPGWMPLTLLVFLSGSAGWILMGMWPLAVFGVFFSVLLAAGSRRRRHRGR